MTQPTLDVRLVDGQPIIDIQIVEAQPQLAVQATSWTQRATALTVTSQDEYDGGIELVRGIKALSAEAEKTIRPTIDAAHKAHKSAVAMLKAITDPLDAAERTIKGKLTVYTQEQQRIQREREAAAAREAARIQAEYMAQQRAAQEEAELAARHAREEEIEATAEALEAQGASAIEVATAIAEAEAQPLYVEVGPIGPPLPPPVPIATPTFEKAKGAAVRVKLRGEVVDPAAFLRWVAADPGRLNLVAPNLPNLTKYINALGSSVAIPGIRVVEDATMAIR